MVKIRKRFFFLLILAIIYPFLFSSIGYSEKHGKELNEWEKLERAAKETWRKNVLGIEKQWDEIEDQQRRELQELKRRIDLLWGEAYQFIYKQNRIITPPYLYQPVNNINLGSAYLYLLYNKHFADIQGRDKRLYLTICGYNWGPTAIRQKIIQRYHVSSMSSDKLYQLLRHRTPKETSDYLKRVTERSNTYSNFF